MATAHEEAAPTFEAWKLRLERTPPEDLGAVQEQFLHLLGTIGTPLLDGAKVHFIYHDPRAVNVAVAGEFNEWARNNEAIPMQRLGGTGLFHHTLIVPGPARLEYKFLVDGEWKSDPLCQHRSGSRGEDTYFVVGDLRDPPELEWNAGTAHGRIEEFEFTSRLLGNRRRVSVHLPAAYDLAADARLPALYVHDGHKYLEHAHITNAMDNLLHDRSILPTIMVLIDPVERRREYKADDSYRDFLCDEFIPAIDDRYRTVRDREGRSVMGTSLGGLGAVYAALTRPQLFARAGGQSSALHYQEERLMTLLRAVAGASIDFYFDVGTYEPRFIPAHRRLVALLREKGWPCRYRELPGSHNWSNWRAHLKDLLVYLCGERAR
jgi:enterochelin esterase family protein